MRTRRSPSGFTWRVLATAVIVALIGTFSVLSSEPAARAGDSPPSGTEILPGAAWEKDANGVAHRTDVVDADDTYRLGNIRLIAESTYNPCADWDRLKAGTARPDVQTWFNGLDGAGYARFKGACFYGIGTAEWNCLYQKINEESGWNHHADGPNGPAGNTWGIPQAYPGTKMADHGADWHDNPRTQVDWMLDYIETRYHGSLFNDSNPCHAGY